MKKILPLILLLVSIGWVVGFRSVETFGLMDRKISIPEETLQKIRSVLETGIIEDESSIVDLSNVQTITISKGRAVFDPPIKVTGKLGLVNVNSTITEVRNQVDGKTILVDIDNSPINVIVGTDR